LDKNGGWIYFENNLNDYIFSHDGGDYENEKEMFDYLELGWEHYIDRLEGVIDELKEENKSTKEKIIDLVNLLN
jgi:hypothetical protein